MLFFWSIPLIVNIASDKFRDSPIPLNVFAHCFKSIYGLPRRLNGHIKVVLVTVSNYDADLQINEAAMVQLDCWQSVFLSIFSLKENGTRHGRGTHEKKNRLQPHVFEDIHTCQNNLIN